MSDTNNKKSNELEDDCDNCDKLLTLSKMVQLEEELTNSGKKKSNRHVNKKYADTNKFWLIKSPPGLYELGKATWTLLHTVAAYYPSTPTDSKKEEINTFLCSLVKSFPCTECSVDMQQYMEHNPPKLDTREQLERWMCEAHNHVNIRLGKPEFNCDFVRERWAYPDNKK